MVQWLVVVVVVLAGLCVFTLLWALRRQAVLRRLHMGIWTLLQSKDPAPLQRSPEDSERILASFDQLAAMIADQRRESQREPRPAEMEVVLERMIAVLRQPLVAIQSYASLLSQAPDLPPSGDTRDLVHTLTFQINGLMRLVESSTDVSQLREGLERELAIGSPGKPTPVALVIDDENPWARRVTEVLRPLRLQVLVAPGTDAALIMARAIRPRALLVNVGRPDGLGWKTLTVLKREHALLHAFIVMYRIAGDGRRGALWVPHDVWFWPLPNNDDSLIVRNAIKSDNIRYALHGDWEVASDVSRWLASAGIVVEPTEGPPPLLIDGCVTLVLADSSGASPEGDSFVLIVPHRMVADDVGRLIRSVERQSERTIVGVADLEVALVEPLRPMADAEREMEKQE